MPFICHIWEAFMRLLNTPVGHVKLLRRIPIRSTVIHVLHVLQVPRMLFLEYRMRVSGSNFSGQSLPTSRYNLFQRPSQATFFHPSISCITLANVWRTIPYPFSFSIFLIWRQQNLLFITMCNYKIGWNYVVSLTENIFYSKNFP